MGSRDSESGTSIRRVLARVGAYAAVSCAVGLSAAAAMACFRALAYLTSSSLLSAAVTVPALFIVPFVLQPVMGENRATVMGAIGGAAAGLAGVFAFVWVLDSLFGRAGSDYADGVQLAALASVGVAVAAGALSTAFRLRRGDRGAWRVIATCAVGLALFASAHAYMGNLLERVLTDSPVTYLGEEFGGIGPNGLQSALDLTGYLYVAVPFGVCATAGIALVSAARDRDLARREGSSCRTSAST